MRVIPSILLVATLFISSSAQAETLKISVKNPLSAPVAKAGAHALRELPQTSDVHVSVHHRIYVVSVSDGQQVADKEVIDRLAHTGLAVTRVQRSDDSFEDVRATLKPSPRRYFKWR